jgi:hypothetical protein
VDPLGGVYLLAKFRPFGRVIHINFIIGGAVYTDAMEMSNRIGNGYQCSRDFPSSSSILTR